VEELCALVEELIAARHARKASANAVPDDETPTQVVSAAS